MFFFDASIISWFLIVLNVLFGAYVLFAQRRNPVATWAWMMVIAFLPLVGFIVYMVMGQDLRKHRVFLKKADNDAAMLDDYHNSFKSKPASDPQTPLMRLHSGVGSTLSEGNSVTLFHDGRAKFDRLLADIEAAERFILIQYYIVRNDEIGKHVIRQLAKKAMEGVEVYFIVDGMGCVFTPRSTYMPLLDAGGHFAVFMPPVPVRLNFRNHRKVVVIDGAVG
jgi:cardiolipin synthase